MEAKRFLSPEIMADYRAYLASETDMEKLMEFQQDCLNMAQTFGELRLAYDSQLGKIISKIPNGSRLRVCKQHGMTVRQINEALKIYELGGAYDAGV